MHHQSITTNNHTMKNNITLRDFITFLNRSGYTPATIHTLSQSAHFSSVIFGDGVWEEFSI